DERWRSHRGRTGPGDRSLPAACGWWRRYRGRPAGGRGPRASGLENRDVSRRHRERRCAPERTALLSFAPWRSAYLWWAYNPLPSTTSEVNMSRTVSRFVTALVLLALALLAIVTTRPSAQIFLGGAPPAGKWEAQPSSKNGEWPSYNADIRGTRYSPLDQINGSNFNKLELAWRFKTDNLGPRPEYKLEGTPIMVKGVLYTTAGVRRSVVALDDTNGEVLWTHRIREGKRAVVSPRQRSGRGVSYWTDGRGDDRVIY